MADPRTRDTVTRPRAGTRSRAVPLLAALSLLLGIAPEAPGAGPAGVAATRTRLPVLRKASTTGPFRICEDQTYALCATASCVVFNGVAYCRCDVEHGDSISLPFEYDDGKDVCDANAEGTGNGYMISTYSFPASAVGPGATTALYDCVADTSTGAYAQCDGGYCFKSTQGQRFPGIEGELAEDEIICSCPITVADPQTATIGYQIAGPFPCDPTFFENCKNPPAGKNTGDTIYVGAPTGAARILTKELYGTVPPFNVCVPPAQ
jgi:hypothetical protein